MTAGIAGGLRARLVLDSVLRFVADGLADLGWLDDGRAHQPVQLLAKPLSWDEPVTPNTVALSFDVSENDDLELGSGLSRSSTSAAFDLYTENDSLAVHLASDIRDLLRGRVGPATRHSVVEVLDYRQATPTAFGYVTVSDVRAHRPAALTSNAWQRHWLQVTFVVHDDYADEAG